MRPPGHEFIRHPLETEALQHVTLDLLDGAGARDIFVGGFSGNPGKPGLVIANWRNLHENRSAAR